MGFNISIRGRRGNNMGSTGSFAFLFIAAILGLVLAGYGFTQFQDQAESVENAVEVEATVTDTDIRIDSSRRSSTDYQAEISFNYSYEGENYSSDFIYPLDDDREFNQESEAEEYLQDYNEGDRVEAYVNPSNPDQGFLNDQRSDQPLIFMLIGGLLMLMVGYKSMKATF